MNIAKTTEEFIKEHPSIKDCLKKNILNYSRLARLLCKERNIPEDNFEAIVIAARRYLRKIAKESYREVPIRKLLAESKIEAKTKMIGAVLDKDVFYKDLISFEKKIKEKKGQYHIIEGSSALTLITGAEFEKEIRTSFSSKVIKINKELVEIVIKSPPKIEETSGTVAYIYGLLGDKGINIVETLSTYTDTILLIAHKDLSKALDILRF